MHGTRHVTLAIVVASLAGYLPARAQDDSILGAPHAHWDVKSLAPVIRSRVHLKASDLPPFPMDSSLSKDAHQWPATRAIEGVSCSLRVESPRTVGSVQEVRPGDGYCLYYLEALRVGYSARRGPMYCWSGEGKLTERSWRTPDSLRTIYSVTTYYRTGEVFMHESRNDSKREAGFDPRGPYEWFQEFFDRRGDLIGCGYGKMDGSGARVIARYWMGREVTRDQYNELELELLRRAFPGPPRQ
jgi:hypothetical protein